MTQLYVSPDLPSIFRCPSWIYIYPWLSIVICDSDYSGITYQCTCTWRTKDNIICLCSFIHCVFYTRYHDCSCLTSCSNRQRPCESCIIHSTRCCCWRGYIVYRQCHSCSYSVEQNDHQSCISLGYPCATYCPLIWFKFT